MPEITFRQKMDPVVWLVFFSTLPLKIPIDVATDSLPEVQWIESGDSESTELLIWISLSLPHGEFRNN